MISMTYRLTATYVSADGTRNAVVQNEDQTRRIFFSTAALSADTVQETLTDDPARGRIARSIQVLRDIDAETAAARFVALVAA